MSEPNWEHILREHAKFVLYRCPDGEAVAGDMVKAADEIKRLREFIEYYAIVTQEGFRTMVSPPNYEEWAKRMDELGCNHVVVF